jgi:hypothetical protein
MLQPPVQDENEIQAVSLDEYEVQPERNTPNHNVRSSQLTSGAVPQLGVDQRAKVAVVQQVQAG